MRYEIEYNLYDMGHAIVVADSREEALNKFNKMRNYELKDNLDDDPECQAVAICEVE